LRRDQRLLVAAVKRSNTAKSTPQIPQISPMEFVKSVESVAFFHE